MGKFTEPIYENVPLPWNSKESKEVRSRAASVPEIKSPMSKVPQKVQPVKEDIVPVKQQNEVTPVKNNSLDKSSNSNVSSHVTSTSISHSAEQSFGNYNFLCMVGIKMNLKFIIIITIIF